MTPEQTLDWLAEQHKSQCNENRPVQEWIRSMKSMLPAPAVQEPALVIYQGEIAKSNLPKGFTGMLYTTPPAAPEPVRKEVYGDSDRYGTGGSYAAGGCYGPAAFTDGDHDGY
jgi:hypothetical protein